MERSVPEARAVCSHRSVQAAPHPTSPQGDVPARPRQRREHTPVGTGARRGQWRNYVQVWKEDKVMNTATMSVNLIIQYPSDSRLNSSTSHFV